MTDRAHKTIRTKKCRFSRCLVLFAVVYLGLSLSAKSQDLIVQKSIASPITATAFSPEAQLLASAQYYRKRVTLWDMRSGRESRTLVPDFDATSLVFSRDGKLLAVATTASTVQLFDCSTGLSTKTLQRQLTAQTDLFLDPKTGQTITIDLPEADYEKGMVTNYSMPLAISDRGVIAAATPISGPMGVQWYVSLWTESGQPAGRLLRLEEADRDSSQITALDFAKGGQTLAVGRTDGAVEVWNMTLHTRTAIFKTRTERMSGIKFSPDGSTVVLYAAGEDSAAVISTNSGELHPVPMMSGAAWSTDGKRLLIGKTGGLDVFDPLSQTLIKTTTFGQPDGSIRGVTALQGGQFILTSATKFFLFDQSTYEVHPVLDSPVQPRTSIALDPSNKDHLLVADADQVRIWDLTSGALLPLTFHAAANIQSIIPSPTGNWYLVESLDPNKPGGDRIYEAVDTASNSARWSLSVEKAESACISPDGSHIAILLDRQQVDILDASDPSKVTQLQIAQPMTAGTLTASLSEKPQLPSAVFAVAFTSPITIATVGLMPPDFLKNVATRHVIGGSPVLQFWDLTSGNKTYSAPIQESVLANNLEASASGEHIAFSFSEGSVVHLWNKQAGHELNPLNRAGTVLAFSQDGDLLASGNVFGYVSLWNTSSGAFISETTIGTGSVNQLCFASDNKTLLISSEDGVQIRDLPSLNLRATFFFSRDRSLVVTPDNYYFAPKGVFDFVSFRLGNRVYAVDQFDITYNRPDKVLQALGSHDDALVSAYRALVSKRLREMAYADAGTHPVSVPELNVVGRIPPSTADKDIDLSVNASDLSTNIQSVAILDNGVPVQSSAKVLTGALGTPTYSAVLNMQLVDGSNHLQISSFNQSGIESLRQSFDVVLERRPPERHLVIVAMGVTNYHDSRYSLRYPAKDAKDFVSLFSNLWQEQLAEAPVLLQDAGADHKSILALKDTVLSKTRVDDEVVILIAGHGLIDSTGMYYFAPFDMDFDHPAALGVSFAEISGLFDSIPARKKLLLLDTCDSGEAATNDPSSGNTSLRIVQKNPGVEVLASSEPIGNHLALGEVFLDLRRGNGTLAIGATTAFQAAGEISGLGNGRFTHALLQGLSENASNELLADANGDGRITFDELRDYLESTVTNLSNGAQTPVMRLGSDEYPFTVLARTQKLVIPQSSVPAVP
jgi:WD40 repeat protein